MNRLSSMVCIRCGGEFAGGNLYSGCPDCRAQGVPANYTPTYNLGGVPTWDQGRRDMWRYRDLLPVDGAPVSLGEGGTPVAHLARLGAELGLPRLFAKDETRNPTWSYKDRLVSVAVSRAVAEGSRGICCSSTGNHGAATAAYAARAGLPCVIMTKADVPTTMKTLMQAYGAMVVALERSEDRWVMLRQCVEALGWTPTSGYCDPPIGSNPYGVDGYKTIAFELQEQLGQTPAWVVVPSSYADGLYGIWKGFRELQAMGLAAARPRLATAEPFGPLAATLARGDGRPVRVQTGPTVSFSIAAALSTYQGAAAVGQSGGVALPAADDAVMAMQLALAGREGLYAEASAAAGLVAAARLRSLGLAAADDLVVVILTSTGLKDPAATATRLPTVPVISPDLPALSGALKDLYGFDLG